MQNPHDEGNLAKIEYEIYTLTAHSHAIAAGKQQRWDVVKWGVTINTALSVAATLVDKRGLIVIATIMVMLIGITLVYYYNHAVTKHRKQLKYTTIYCKEKLSADCDGVLGDEEYNSLVARTFFFDIFELKLFAIILLASTAPVFSLWIGWITLGI